MIVYRGGNWEAGLLMTIHMTKFFNLSLSSNMIEYSTMNDRGRPLEGQIIYNPDFFSTIVAGTTDSEGEIVPCSQEEGGNCGQGGTTRQWTDIEIEEVEDEVFASTVTDRVIKWANDNAEVDDFDTEVDVAADVWNGSGIRGEEDYHAPCVLYGTVCWGMCWVIFYLAKRNP